MNCGLEEGVCMAKHDDDNHSNQLNPNNEAYSSSRNCMSDDDDDSSEVSISNHSVFLLVCLS